MADRIIVVKVGELPAAQAVYDDTLIPGERQGEALHLTGGQLKDYVQAASAAYVQRSVDAADAAQKSESAAAESAKDAGVDAGRAKTEADRAELARQAIENLTVTARSVPPGEEASVIKTVLEGFVNLLFNVPRGEQGATGPQGAQGIQGVQGPQGPAGVVAEMLGLYAFHVNEEGHLILTYDDSATPPSFQLREDGHLYHRRAADPRQRRAALVLQDGVQRRQRGDRGERLKTKNTLQKSKVFFPIRI